MFGIGGARCQCDQSGGGQQAEKQVVFSTRIKSLDFIPSATEALKSFQKGGETHVLHF